MKCRKMGSILKFNVFEHSMKQNDILMLLCFERNVFICGINLFEIVSIFPSCKRSFRKFTCCEQRYLKLFFFSIYCSQLTTIFQILSYFYIKRSLAVYIESSVAVYISLLINHFFADKMHRRFLRGFRNSVV